jgi:septal ring factor EnvC (AmiA/AmiB activator)
VAEDAISGPEEAETKAATLSLFTDLLSLNFQVAAKEEEAAGHAKVAEDAVTGWEEAETKAAALEEDLQRLMEEEENTKRERAAVQQQLKEAQDREAKLKAEIEQQKKKDGSLR